MVRDVTRIEQSGRMMEGVGGTAGGERGGGACSLDPGQAEARAGRPHDLDRLLDERVGNIMLSTVPGDGSQYRE